MYECAVDGVDIPLWASESFEHFDVLACPGYVGPLDGGGETLVLGHEEGAEVDIG